MPTRAVEEYPLFASSMANSRILKIHRYGSGDDGPKVYIQAGLHADEPPGYLVMHHLIGLLDQFDDQGDIRGEIVLVPVANPIGTSQWQEDRLQGRFNSSDGINFNRSFPDLTTAVAERLKGRLDDDAVANIHLIRRAFAQALDECQPENEAAHLKHKLLSAAHDADIVLDLHCDYEAVMHVYMGASLWPAAHDLSAWLGAQATLLADDSGVTPFDEACSRIWWKLARRFPEHPIPPACLAATVELRGQTDMSHAMATEDAGNIIRFLIGRGVVRGQVGEPPALVNDATLLNAVEHVKAPAPGVVVFFKQPGDKITAGETLAEIINPLAPTVTDRIQPVGALTDGLLYACSADRLARPGRILAKIAGRQSLRPEGANLLTL
jgi:predicted deacylase